MRCNQNLFFTLFGSFRKDLPNILEGLEQIERARLNCIHRCMRRHGATTVNLFSRSRHSLSPLSTLQLHGLPSRNPDSAANAMARNQQVRPLPRAALQAANKSPPFPDHPPSQLLPCSAIDSIQIDPDLGAFVSSLSTVSVLKSFQQQAEEP